jgi:hypothetical protein
LMQQAPQIFEQGRSPTACHDPTTQHEVHLSMQRVAAKPRCGLFVTAEHSTCARTHRPGPKVPGPYLERDRPPPPATSPHRGRRQHLRQEVAAAGDCIGRGEDPGASCPAGDTGKALGAWLHQLCVWRCVLCVVCCRAVCLEALCRVCLYPLQCGCGCSGRLVRSRCCDLGGVI